MKTRLFTALAASLMLLVSATVWEGVSAAVPSEELPGDYSIATNSFPQSSVLDITNLENGKMVRVVVVSGLQTSGLLAKLSPGAADSIDLRGNATCRIRMTEAPEGIVLAAFKLGPLAAPAPAVVYAADDPPAGTETPLYISEAEDSDAYNMYDEAQAPVAEAALLARNPEDSAAEQEPQEAQSSQEMAVVAAEPAPELVPEHIEEVKVVEAPNQTEAEPQPGQRLDADAGQAAVVMSNTTDEPIAEMAITADETAGEPFAAAATPALTENAPPEEEKGSVMVSIVPSEERLPAASAGQPSRIVIAPESLPIVQAEHIPTSDFSPFQVPLISRLEQGKWYVQVAAYARPDHVEDEISRIGPDYPLAVQNAGTDTSPMFRILLGPLNKGESGALLQRFKSIGYEDAFLRNRNED